MNLRRRHILVSLGAFTLSILSGCQNRQSNERASANSSASSNTGRTKLVVGLQDIALRETVTASGVLDGFPYDLQWAIIPGPAAQLSALYSKAIDIGLVGDTSLIIEQAKAKEDWTEANVPLQTVALWKNPDPALRLYVTAVRKSANIDTLADLRGKKWAFNYGGLNYFTYVLSRHEAGLKVSDIVPVQLVDGPAAAAAFKSGRADVYSGSIGTIKDDLDSGNSRILLQGEDLGILGATAFTARTDVIRDSDISKALSEFLARVRKHWTWIAQNRDVVEKLYVDKRKQTPQQAKFFALIDSAQFIPIDDALLTRQQRLADILFNSGEITKKINLSVEFNQKFNPATTGSN